MYWSAEGALRRAPLEGGDASTLVRDVDVRDVTAADGFVYFTDGRADIVARIDREGGTPQSLGSGTSPSGIGVHAGAVYWANRGTMVGSNADGSLATASVDGTSARILVGALNQPAGVAVDNDFVYFTSTAMDCFSSSSGESGCYGGGVSKVARGGGEPTFVAPDAITGNVVVGERGVYWMTARRARIMFAPHDGGGVETLAELPGEDPGAIALDSDAFYFASSGEGRAIKVALDDGEPQRLVTDLGRVSGIAVDDDWVYAVSATQGSIVRVAKDGSASRPTEPVTGPCPTPIGTAAAIESTPRQDENLELLALSLDAGEIVATQATYDRVVADVTAIRNLEPDLTDIGYYARYDGKVLVLRPTDLTFEAMRVELYSAWDCLNDFYGLESVDLVEGIGSPRVILTLKGVYDTEMLGQLYAQLPGVEVAEPDWFGGDGPTICALRDGSSIEYVVDRAGGDCPSGCTTHEAQHFHSTAPGEIELLEVWGGDTRPPEWFTRVCSR